MRILYEGASSVESFENPVLKGHGLFDDEMMKPFVERGEGVVIRRLVVDPVHNYLGP